MTAHEFLTASIAAVSSEAFDFTLPPALEGRVSLTDWSDFSACLISEALHKSEIERFTNGVVEYRHVAFYPNDEDGEHLEELDAFVTKIDMVALFERNSNFRTDEGWEQAMLEMHIANRNTPMFRWLQKDYPAALERIHLGLSHLERGYNHTEGDWYCHQELPYKFWIEVPFFGRNRAHAYIALEGKRQEILTRDCLEGWGVTEEQFFADLRMASFDANAEGLTQIDTFYDQLDLHMTNLFRPKGNIPDVVWGMADAQPHRHGSCGAIIALVGETGGYVFKIEGGQDLISTVAVMAPHYYREYKDNFYNPKYGQNFPNELYWHYDGIFEKVEYKDDGNVENLELNILMSERMRRTFTDLLFEH